MNAPKGFITLRAAMAHVGSRVVFGWQGNELSLNIWRAPEAPGNALAQYRYTLLGNWLHGLAMNGGFSLLYFDGGEWREVPRAHLVQRECGALYMSGRFSSVSAEGLVAGHSDDSKPELYVDQSILDGLIELHLQPDTSTRWTFSQAVAWLATRRHDFVREYAGHFGFIFADLRRYYSTAALVSGEDALSDIWRELEAGKLIGFAVGVSDGMPQLVPAEQWHYLKLNANGVHEHLTMTAGLGGIAYYEPTLSREAVVERWRPMSSAARPSQIRKNEHAHYDRLIRPLFKQYVADLIKHPQQPKPPSFGCDLRVIDEIAGRSIPRRLAEQIRKGLVPLDWQKSGDKRRTSFDELGRLTPPIVIRRAETA